MNINQRLTELEEKIAMGQGGPPMVVLTGGYEPPNLVGQDLGNGMRLIGRSSLQELDQLRAFKVEIGRDDGVFSEKPRDAIVEG